MKYKCLIVEDENLARKLLQSYIEKMPQLELVTTCKNPLEAAEILSKEQIDIMFLDIQMPEMTGIEFLRTLINKPIVIFTTAYQDYAIEGYQLDVIDYLLKPFSFERLMKAVNKAIEQIKLKNRAEENIAQPTNNSTKDYLVIKADHKIHKISFDSILYVEGLKEYVTIFTTSGKFVTLESLKHLESILPSNNFLRVHKSYIVAKDKVANLEGNQLQINKVKIPIGKSYKEKVISNLF